MPLTPRSTLFPYTTLFRSHRDVRGVVPVLGVLRALDLQLARQPALDGDGAVGGERGQGLQDFLSELFRGHRISLMARSEEHTSELQSLRHLVCRLLLEKKN